MPRPPLMDQYDKELSMDHHHTMLPLTNMQQNNTKLPSSRSTSSYGLENDDNFFDGILAADQHQHQHHHEEMQNGCGSHDINSKNDNNDSFPMKRALTASSQFWNETGSPGSSSSSKRFHGDLNSGNSNAEENNSFVSLLSQLPTTTTFHPNAILGDAVIRQQFQLPNINWN